jgi:hypothetical protein
VRVNALAALAGTTTTTTNTTAAIDRIVPRAYAALTGVGAARRSLLAMTRDQAVAECRHLETDEDASGRWIAHEVAPGDWRRTRISGGGL